jgi:hypothetical protein
VEVAADTVVDGDLSPSVSTGGVTEPKRTVSDVDQKGFR